jgi:excisionase family DNA binding protein
MTATMTDETYLPEQSGRLADVYDFLAAHEDRRGAAPAPRYVLAGADIHDSVEVPLEVHRVLLQVVEALNAGKAVTVAPRGQRLTTQQAADLLNISRPTLVKLIDTGELPGERVSNRRQVLLSDVLAYRQRRREQQYAELLQDAADRVEEDPEEVLAALQQARKAVAAARRRG